MNFLSILILSISLILAAADDEKLSIEDLKYLLSDRPKQAEKIQKITQSFCALDEKSKSNLISQIIEQKELELLQLLYPDNPKKCLQVLKSVNFSDIPPEIKLNFIHFFTAHLKMAPEKQAKEFSEIAVEFISICLSDQKNSEVISSAVKAANKFNLDGLINEIILISTNKDYSLEIRIEGLLYLLRNNTKKAELIKKSINEEIKLIPDLESQLEYAEKLKDLQLKQSILLEALKSENPDTRLSAYLTLNKLTGKSFNYNPIGSREEIENSIKQWKKFFNENQNQKP